MSFEQWQAAVDRWFVQNAFPHRCADLDPTDLRVAFDAGQSPIVAAKALAGKPAPAITPADSPPVNRPKVDIDAKALRSVATVLGIGSSLGLTLSFVLSVVCVYRATRAADELAAGLVVQAALLFFLFVCGVALYGLSRVFRLAARWAERNPA